MRRVTGTWRWTGVAALVALAVSAAIGPWVVGLNSHPRRQLAYCDIKSNDSRDEVRYRLGYPPFVLEEPKNHFAAVYATDPNTDPKNAIPPDRCRGHASGEHYG